MPSNPLRPGVSELTFRTLPSGWRVADELLFPAAAVGSEDEQRQIASIPNDGTTIRLSSPLRFDHVPPTGVGGEVPVGNLTRNVILASTETGALHQRAHVMVMSHEPVHISGAAFRGLGRTTATRPHTLTVVDEHGRGVGGRESDWPLCSSFSPRLGRIAHDVTPRLQRQRDCRQPEARPRQSRRLRRRRGQCHVRDRWLAFLCRKRQRDWGISTQPRRVLPRIGRAHRRETRGNRRLRAWRPRILVQQSCARHGGQLCFSSRGPRM